MRLYFKVAALIVLFGVLAIAVDQYAAWRRFQQLLDQASYQSPGMERTIMEARDRCWFVQKTLSTIRTDLERSATQPTTQESEN